MFKPLSITLALAAAFPQLVHAEQAAAAADTARVIVTGSNLRVTEKEGAAAMEVISAKDIAASGKTSIADVIRAIAANSGNSYNEQYTGSFSAGTAGVSLRGLGQKNTLILVNGKRVSPYATAQDMQEVFVDLNSLPMAAVQRIEVLKDGASSIYGSDAVAGVVNIILYQEFKGTELTVEGGASTQGTGQTERRAALQTGLGVLAENGYSLVFALDAQQRSKLQQTDADWMRGSDFRSEQNGALAWVPTNYYGSDATRLLGGLQGPLELKPYGAITEGKQGQVQAYNPAQYKTLLARRPDLRRAADRQQRAARLEQPEQKTRQHQRGAAGRPSEQSGHDAAGDHRHAVRPRPAPEGRQGGLLPRAGRRQGPGGRLGRGRLAGPLGQHAGGDGAELRQPLRV